MGLAVVRQEKLITDELDREGKVSDHDGIA